MPYQPQNFFSGLRLFHLRTPEGHVEVVGIQLTFIQHVEIIANVETSFPHETSLGLTSSNLCEDKILPLCFCPAFPEVSSLSFGLVENSCSSQSPQCIIRNTSGVLRSEPSSWMHLAYSSQTQAHPWQVGVRKVCET